MPHRTGVSTNTYKEYLIGPGAVYYNWQSVDSLGTCLGETKGGNVFEVIPTFHEIEPDGAYGHVEDHTRISRVDIRLTANLLGVTTANILKVLAGSQMAEYNIIHIPSEYLGEGESSTATQTMAIVGSKTIISATLRVYQSTDSAPVLLVRSSDYSYTTTDGFITLAIGGVAASASITAEYDYDTGTGDTTGVITIDQLVTGDELTNIAIVGEISDVGKTKDAALIVENALCMNGLTLTLPGGNEEPSVVTAVFEGHWSVDDLSVSNAPFSIRYDNT